MSLYHFIILFIGISFIFYAFNALFSQYMKDEFLRWGFQKYRVFISILQLFFGMLFLTGFIYPFLFIYCSSFFLLMMLGAIFVRFRIKDGLFEMLPAYLYFFLNLIIFFIELKQII